MKKKALLAAVLATFCLLIVVSALAINAYADPTLLLHPTGRIRVALRSYGNGYAQWWPKEPQVFDGSFSVEIYTGSSGTAGGIIYIGPLSWALSMFTDDRITFWTYHLDDGASPYVNIVLDNGRTMEGIGSWPVVPGTVINTQTGLGFPTSDLWVQMRPAGGVDGHHTWYTSTGIGTDPLLVSKGLDTCTSSSPCTMAQWQKAFPTAKVIQIQILYGLWSSNNQHIFIDNVSILGVPVPLEPEDICATAAVSP
jgi:hypothetical protein